MLTAAYGMFSMCQAQGDLLCSVWQVNGTATRGTASTLRQHVHKLLSSSDKPYSSSGFAVCSSVEGCFVPDWMLPISSDARNTYTG